MEVNIGPLWFLLLTLCSILFCFALLFVFFECMALSILQKADKGLHDV